MGPLKIALLVVVTFGLLAIVTIFRSGRASVAHAQTKVARTATALSNCPDEPQLGNGQAIDYSKLSNGGYSKMYIVDRAAGLEVVKYKNPALLFAQPEPLLVKNVPPEILKLEWFPVHNLPAY